MGKATTNNVPRVNNKSFTVTLDLPKGVRVVDAQEYVRAAVATHKGGLDPELPIYNLDGDSVKVKPVPSPKKEKK